MFPIRDALPTQRRPIITLLLIALNVAVFLMGFGTATGERNASLADVRQHDVWVYEYGLIPCELFDRCANQPARGLTGGPNDPLGRIEPQEVVLPTNEQPAWLTLFSSAFLHGGWLHLLGNMLFLWIYGNNVEDSMSRVKFVVFYLLAGVVAGLAQSFTNGDSTIPQIGASGAIAGTIGAYLMLYPKARILTMVLPPIPLFLHLSAWIVAGLWGAQQFIATTQSLTLPAGGGEGGVAFMAHLAGFVFGLAVIKLIATRNPVYDQMYGDGAGRGFNSQWGRYPRQGSYR